MLETTGTYYLALAYHLVAAGAEVAVLNPLVVRRFIQMSLGKGKLESQGLKREADLLAWVEQRQGRKLPLLQSTPGIGRKTMAWLLVFARSFSDL